jgi:hypothetical protein
MKFDKSGKSSRRLFRIEEQTLRGALVARHVNRFDLLHDGRKVGQAHRAAIAVFIVFAFQTSLVLRLESGCGLSEP